MSMRLSPSSITLCGPRSLIFFFFRWEGSLAWPSFVFGPFSTAIKSSENLAVSTHLKSIFFFVFFSWLGRDIEKTWHLPYSDTFCCLLTKDEQIFSSRINVTFIFWNELESVIWFFLLGNSFLNLQFTFFHPYISCCSWSKNPLTIRPYNYRVFALHGL